MVGRYQDADAFRTALEHRIRIASQTTGVSHDRLRKDVAFQRLVARFVAVGDDRWVIKGGVGLLWRVGHEVRATRDIDANWQGNENDLESFLDAAVAQDPGDGFEFEIGAPRPLQGETKGALRRARNLTQVELARRLNRAQASISAMENADDNLVSTLRTVVESMGGHLELVAVFGDERIALLPKPTEHDDTASDVA